MRLAVSLAVILLQGCVITYAWPAPSPPPKYPFFKREVRKHLRPFVERVARRVDRRDLVQPGEPQDSLGKGAPILGPTNHELDLQNPDNLGNAASTDAGNVVNFKWSFSDSHTRLFNGGWLREQVQSDLPSSEDISAANQHLKKGASRELHWHSLSEWGYMLNGSLIITSIDETGRNTVFQVDPGDIWYFPKGSAHMLQGVQDQNEFILAFDKPNFDDLGTSFQVDDWISHTPPEILAKNFGVDASIFKDVPKTTPFIFQTTVTDGKVDSPFGKLDGASSFKFAGSKVKPTEVPGGGGTVSIVDSRNFPIAKTLAASIVTVKPKGMREMHWHPNAAEWDFFISGHARVTVFVGQAQARTFDFSAGDTAVWPDNAGHYVENTSATEELKFIEIFKADHVADISLTQWLALTPADIVAATLNVPRDFVDKLKKEKQVIVQG